MDKTFKVKNDLLVNGAIYANSSILNLNGAALAIAGSVGLAGQVVGSNGTNTVWTSTPGTSPGGSNTDVQFNDSGAFNGSGGLFTWNKTLQTVTISNTLITQTVNATGTSYFGINTINSTAFASGNTVLSSVIFTIGNTTVNTTVNSTQITLANSTSVANIQNGFLYLGNSSANLTINSSSIFSSGNFQLYLGNTTVNTVVNSSIICIGNSTVNVQINSTAVSLAANMIVNTTMLTVGNSTVNVQINSSSVTFSGSSASGRVLLNNLTASGSAYLTDTTSLTSAWDQYDIVFENVIASVDDSVFEMLISTNGGSSYLTTGYLVAIGVADTDGGSAATDSTTYVQLNYVGVGNTIGLSGTITLFNPTATGRVTFIQGLTTNYVNGFVYVSTIGGYNSTTNGINALKFLMSSGNISSGTIKIYGKS